jgi:DNA-binding CsgD family transcriptional regulator
MVFSINRSIIKNPRLEFRIKIFGLLYFVLFFLETMVIDFLEYNYYSYTITEFFMHLPPLYYLRFLLKKHFPKGVFKPETLKINEFLSRHNISDREKEIILLILDGKSNREIEEELYISIKTVKTHIYKIYKKLGISSRWHLFSLLK